MEKKIYVICVLYNQRIDAIKSLNQFLQLYNKYQVKLIIEDNSEDDFVEYNRTACRTIYSEKIIYECNHGNIGLSKAYNNAINLIEDDEYWVMLADDDTDFSMEYLENLVDAVEIDSFKVISGIIKTKKGYMSPIKALKISNRPDDFIIRAGKYTNIYCINSGLCIESTILKQIGLFDEHLFLNMIDFCLMEKMMDYSINSIHIIEGNIYQDFSSLISSKNVKKELFRFQLFEKDFLYFCKIRRKPFFYQIIILSKRFVNILIKLIYSKGIKNEN